MARRDKREQRIRDNPRNVSLAEFEALIRRHGHIKEGGPHPKARIGPSTMPYKRENPVKPVYVEELLQMIDAALGREKET